MTKDVGKFIPGLAVCCLVMLVLLADNFGSTKIAVAALIGGLAGFSLYHAKFGFTAAWHRFVSQKRGAGLRSQFVLILLTSLIAYPIFYYGPEFGLNVNGFVFPFGVSAAFGAFMFGIGMQLGGSCASGTLFTVGGGSTRMAVTLIFFVLGSVIATAHLPMWSELPRLPAYSLVKNFGVLAAFALTASILVAIAFITMIVERLSHGEIAKSPKTESVLNGPWSYLAGALALTAVSVATILVVGRPWGITSAFSLWGAKWFYFLGIPIDSWEYWDNRMGAVNRSVFAHTTSVMNFGIVIGALLASGLAGKFAPTFSIKAKGIVTAVIGGLMMGYGARLAYGCNIGAYLGGVISGSLHGWGWLVFGFMGSMVGSKIRDRINAF